MAFDDDIRRIGEYVDGIVAQVCARHYSADTQEHQLTSKIADRLEERLKGVRIGGHLIEVFVQDFSDKGPNSREVRTGADLYISVVLKHPVAPINKGMLVQSKWDHSKSARGTAAQSSKMQARTSSSYIFAYGPLGAAVEPSDGRREGFSSPTVGRLIEEAFKCNEGDVNIARELNVPPIQGLNRVMERLAADIGVAFQITGVSTLRPRQ